jgi:hypothetical protein
LVLYLGPAQPQSVREYGYRGEGHRGCRQHGVEKTILPEHRSQDPRHAPIGEERVEDTGRYWDQSHVVGRLSAFTLVRVCLMLYPPTLYCQGSGTRGESTTRIASKAASASRHRSTSSTSSQACSTCSVTAWRAVSTRVARSPDRCRRIGPLLPLFTEVRGRGILRSSNAGASLLANYHDRARSVPDYRIGDAAYQNPSYPSETSTPYHDKPCSELVRQQDDCRVRPS